ncbi:MAG: hypothetical protein JEZ07_02790 [Phycisphaerae bacterium]|nr:hypothetical protein [Phycisphaerae bacterium]
MYKKVIIIVIIITLLLWYLLRQDKTKPSNTEQAQSSQSIDKNNLSQTSGSSSAALDTTTILTEDDQLIPGVPSMPDIPDLPTSDSKPKGILNADDFDKYSELGTYIDTNINKTDDMLPGKYINSEVMVLDNNTLKFQRAYPGNITITWTSTYIITDKQKKSFVIREIPDKDIINALATQSIKFNREIPSTIKGQFAGDKLIIFGKTYTRR